MAWSSEVVLLWTVTPAIIVAISGILIWYYATRVSDSLFEKIMIIGLALLLDSIILNIAISLFSAITP